MRLHKLILLTLLILAGNFVCRTAASCDVHNTANREGKYHIFSRGIDDVAIIVDNVIPSSISSSSTQRHNSNHGRIHTTVFRPAEPGSKNRKTTICRITTASKPHTLYFIFALHRMRD